jgi:hypothetical protein
MSDQDGVQILDVFADGGQPLGDFAAAQSDVYKYAGVTGRKEYGITGTAAGENANFDDRFLLPLAGAFSLRYTTR